MFRTLKPGALLAVLFAFALAACDPSDGGGGPASDPSGPPPHRDPTQPPSPDPGQVPPPPPGPGEGPNLPPPPVPEPGTVLLVGSGLAGMAILARRRRKSGTAVSDTAAGSS